MGNCNTTSSNPITQVTDPCNGSRTSTVCVFEENALTILGLPADSSQSDINAAIQNALFTLQSTIFDQNNMNRFISYTINDFDLLSNSGVATYINTLPQFTVNEFETLYIKILPNLAAGNFDNFVYTVYVLENLGKGTYGTGGTAITRNDLERVGSYRITIDDIIENVDTQFIDLGDVGGSDIVTAFNAHTFTGEEDPIQNQEDGYVIIDVTISGQDLQYLFVGTGGSYGVTGVETAVADDFLLLTGVYDVPTADTLQTVTNAGNVTTNTMQTPSILSDQTGETNWFRVTKDYLSLGNLGDGVGNPYGGATTKYISIFDPNSPVGADGIFMRNDDGTDEFIFNLTKGNVILSATDGLNTGSFSSNSGLISIISNIGTLESTLSFETPVVSDHIYRVPASNGIAGINYLTIGAETSFSGLSELAGSDGLINLDKFVDLAVVLGLSQYAELDSNNFIRLNVEDNSTDPYGVDFRFGDADDYTRYFQSEDTFTLQKSVSGEETTMDFADPTVTSTVLIPAPPTAGISDPASPSDTCENAPVLYVGDSIASSTIGATSTGYISCGGSPSNGEGIWFKMVGNGVSNTLTASSPVGISPQINVYDGDCGSLACFVGGGITGQGSATVTFTPTLGDVYYITVVGAFTSEGSFTMERTSVGQGVEDSGIYPLTHTVDGVRASLDGSISTSIKTDDTGSVINLGYGKNFCNMGSANSNITYNIVNEGLIGAEAIVLINAASEPRITATTATTAGSFIIGREYQISTVGTTDFTLIGASSNTVGVNFTATGVGVGTGEATLNYEKDAGSAFIISTDMYMIVQNNGTDIRYLFMERIP